MTDMTETGLATIEYQVGLRLKSKQTNSYIILDEVMEINNYKYFTIDELDNIIVQVRKLMRQDIIEATDDLLDEAVYESLRDKVGGSGFSLGTEEPNSFDAGSGNRAAAETLRDNHATANADWLQYYTDNPTSGIVLLYVEDGNRVSTYQNYIDGEWVDNSSTIAIQGTPGSGTDFSTISENHIPAIGAGPDKFPYDSGLSVDPVTNDLVTPGSLRIGSNTLSLDFGHSMSSGVQNVVTRNISSGINYMPSWTEISKTGNPRNKCRTYTSELVTRLVGQPDDSDELTNPQWDYTASINIRIFDVYLKLKDATEILELYILHPTTLRTVWRERFGPFEAGEIQINTLGSTSPIDIAQGNQWKLGVRRPDGSDIILLGRGDLGIPWNASDHREWVDKDHALVEELPTAASLFSNPTWVARDSSDSDVTYGGFSITGRIRKRVVSTGVDTWFTSTGVTLPITDLSSWTDWTNRETLTYIAETD